MSTLVWRIDRQKHAENAFTGIGAKLNGGRWNSVGMSVAYSSANLSLSTLEKLVHMQLRHFSSKQNLVFISAEIPDPVLIERREETDLPQNWRSAEP